jgi:hypothetical protein
MKAPDLATNGYQELTSGSWKKRSIELHGKPTLRVVYPGVAKDLVTNEAAAQDPALGEALLRAACKEDKGSDEDASLQMFLADKCLVYAVAPLASGSSTAPTAPADAAQ